MRTDPVTEGLLEGSRMRLAWGHSGDRAGTTGQKLQKASPIPNFLLSLGASAGFCDLCSPPSAGGPSHTCRPFSALDGRKRGCRGKKGHDHQRNIYKQGGEACAKDAHLRGQEMGKKEVGGESRGRKKTEGKWMVQSEIPGKKPPHPKQTLHFSL